MAGSANPLLRIRRSPHFVGCKEDHQCPTGFFCEVTQLSCRACLSCEQLNRRQTRENTTTCVTSVTACGACFAGLVPGQADNKCFPPTDGQQVLLPYEWAVIVIGLLLTVLICVAAVYVLRNFNTFKIRAFTRTSVLSPVDVEASAPQLPPSYNDVAASPPENQIRNEDERAPFIKPIPSPPARDVRETAGHLAARVFNNPSYVRTLQPPRTGSSYETPNVQETLPTIQEADTNINSNDSFVNNENAMATDVEEASANAMQVSRSSSEKLLQAEARQDTNNNGGGGDERNCSFAQTSGTVFIINVIKNVDTVQQQNEMIIN